MNKNNNWLGWVIGLIVLGLIGFFLIDAGVLDRDEVDDMNVTNPIIDDDTDNNVIDRGTNDITPEGGIDIDAELDNETSILNPDLSSDEITFYEGVVVTEVVSDRMFRINDAEGSSVLMYLDDQLDLENSEFVVDVNEGTVVNVNGRFTSDLSGQTLEEDESNTINVDETVFLVTSFDI